MSQLDYNFSGRDYTARFEALLTRLRDEVPNLTDLNHSDAGVSILRLLARESDQLAFYIDEAFREGFIDLARFMQSLIDIAKTVDILPKLASSAQTTLTLTRKPGQTDLISIARYKAFSKSDGKTYLADDAVDLPVGTNSIDIQVTQGTLVTLSLEPGDFTISELTGRAEYNLGVDVAAGSVELEHGNPAVPWTEVDSFWRSLPTDLHFRVELFAEPVGGLLNTAVLVLGDDSQGQQLPPSTLTVRFLRTAGPDGNCGSGIITGAPTDLADLVTVTNSEAATGGGKIEAIADFRERIPRVVRTQRRGVVCEDYEALIESIPGVRHCQAVDRNYGSEWPHMYVVLFVVPEGGGPMAEQLEGTIYTQCEEWGHLGSWSKRYILKDATEVPVNVTVSVGKVTGYGDSAVACAIQAAIDEVFWPENQDIGESLSFADLYKAVTSVAGVSWAQFVSPTADVEISTGEIAVTGTITVTIT